MKKVLMVATVASMIGQFNMDNIEILQKLGYKVYVACNMDDNSVWPNERINSFKQSLNEKNIKYFNLNFSRNPLNLKSNINAYQQILNVIKNEKIDLIHCHTPVGGVVSRLAAHKMNIKVIYTAHGFHFYKGASIKKWMLFFPIEKILSRWTDVLITINSEDYKLAMKRFKAKRIEYVPGVGIDIKKNQLNTVNRTEKRKELGLKDNDILILSVGELSERKNHKEVIQALAELKNMNGFEHIQYYICGKGLLLNELESLARKLNIDEHIHFLGFRTDVKELCQIADLYIFPSFQEGLPVALMEAIANKAPVICSQIRGNEDLVLNSADMFSAFDYQTLVEVLKRVCIAENCINRNAIEQSMQEDIELNYKNLSRFDISCVEEKMNKIYSEI